jgi:hypothetical protein
LLTQFIFLTIFFKNRFYSLRPVTGMIAALVSIKLNDNTKLETGV